MMNKEMKVYVEKFIKTAFKQKIESYPRTPYNYLRTPLYTGGASVYRFKNDSKEKASYKKHEGSQDGEDRK